ncbi:endolytic transglycosylase MltG [Candidatus Sumerlaeota bacterium]|nr:endolytic transglycosylase MltG [Candidatus Sumerlaeota bacterium]
MTDTEPCKTKHALYRTDPASVPPSGGHEAAFAPGPKRGGCRRTISWILQALGVLFLLALLCGVGAGGWFFYWMHRPQSADRAEAARVELRKGDSVRTIARRLREGGVVDSETLFLAAAVWRRADRRLKAGEYAFAPGLAPNDVIDLLVKGPDILSVKVTFPEGWTASRMAQRLAEKGAIVSAERLEALCGDAEFLSSLGVPDTQAEGYLFPDTYVFVQPTDEKEAIQRLVRRQGEIVRSLGLRPGLNSADAAPLTFRQGVILASIVEREVSDPEEMSLVSSVFHNRLKRGMKLDSCATVRHALNKWDAPLTLSDLKCDSPYNTYARAGLPPTPICNPGRAALDAAFRPARSDYLYYVYRGDGRHAFSKTLREHLAARKRYKEAWGKSASRERDDTGPTAVEDEATSSTR